MRITALEVERAGEALFDHPDLHQRGVSSWERGRSFPTPHFSALVLQWPLAGASFTEVDTHVLGIGLESSN